MYHRSGEKPLTKSEWNQESKLVPPLEHQRVEEACASCNSSNSLPECISQTKPKLVVFTTKNWSKAQKVTEAPENSGSRQHLNCTPPPPTSTNAGSPPKKKTPETRALGQASCMACSRELVGRYPVLKVGERGTKRNTHLMGPRPDF